MDGHEERSRALRLLEGLEGGSLSPMNAGVLADELDPVLVHAIIAYLRAIHPAGDPAATPVLERVVKMTSAVPALVRRHREGADDPITKWFESEYAYADFRGRREDLVDTLIDKLES